MTTEKKTTLELIFDDFNGVPVMTSGVFEWGFIPDAWYLYIPHGMKLPEKPTIGVSPFTSAQMQQNFIAVNYAGLRDACKSNNEALLYALLRLKIAEHGAVCSSKDARHVTVNEYHYCTAEQTRDAIDAINKIGLNTNVTTWVGNNWVSVVSHLIYAFLARGHHWQASYEELYSRLQQACGFDFNGVCNTTHETMYRLSLHCFGVAPLFNLNKHNIDNGLLIAPMEIRYNPSPPVAGVAHIKTTMAVLNAMKSELWWGDFENQFQQPIDDLIKMDNAINAEPLSYHVAAKVLTGNNRKMVPEEIHRSFMAISQYILGYLRFLGRGHTLYGQQAISKAAGGEKGLCMSFAAACSDYTKPGFIAHNMRQWLSGVNGVIPPEIQEEIREQLADKAAARRHSEAFDAVLLQRVGAQPAPIV